jgi:uncharacterized protein YciI
MAYYALFYQVVEDFVRKRTPLRQVHLEHARRAAEQGELVLAGALADPADGALLVFRGEDRAGAEAFAREDPYVTNGLVTEWRVRPWTVVVGHYLPPEETPSLDR